MKRLALASTSLLFVVAVASLAQAAVTRVDIKSRAVVANGQWFGAAGPYEKIVGTVFFEVDPVEPHNAAIADIALAPRNARGRVEFSSDFFILAPQDPARSSGSVLFEVSNRGGKGLLSTFNRGTASADPMKPSDFGDGLLMRNGFTLVWVGWEFDVGSLSLNPPVATRNGSSLIETIAAQATVDSRATEVSFSDVPLYPPFDPNDETATLTVRDQIWDRPTPLPRRSWQFVPPVSPGTGRCAGNTKCPRISMTSGFEPGRIYEVKYRASNPPVSGVGFAAIRDLAAAMKYGGDVPAHGKYLHIYGASQSGRFLRQYLYDGFNLDEQGRKVFDGVMPHIAGAGRGDFNTRFSQAVGLDQYAALKFPFTDAPQRDDATGRTDALLGKYQGADLQPKILYTNSSVEYWGTGRAAALIHTSIDGSTDLTLPANVRAYMVAGSQHGPAQFPPRAAAEADGPNSRGTGQQLPNPTPHTIALRSFVLALDRWVREGVEPPASRYPHVSDGTLTPIAKFAWPALPGVTSPVIIPQPRRASGDGPEGGRWPFLVPQVDEDGNERGGIRLPDVAVPVGTLTGWNFRNPATGNPTAVVPLLGSFIPFARTAADRAASKDPRRSIAERYPSRQDYLGRVTEVTLDLVKQGYVLREDATFLLDRASATWDWMAQRPATPTAQR